MVMLMLSIYNKKPVIDGLNVMHPSKLSLRRISCLLT